MRFFLIVTAMLLAAAALLHEGLVILESMQPEPVAISADWQDCGCECS